MKDKKRFIPREEKQERPHPLGLQPNRDDQALILPISIIRVPANIRSKLENIEELAASIRANGLLQPLIVAKVGSSLELVGGQRRLAALKMIGMTEAPVRIVNANADQIAVFRLIENIQRDELSGWDTCKSIAALLPMFKSQRDLANAIGKTESYVSKCLAVVKSKPELERVQALPLRELFSRENEKQRKPSGPLAGGRAVSGALQYREKSGGKAFALRINFDSNKTPPETKNQIIKTLEALLSKLKGT